MRDRLLKESDVLRAVDNRIKELSLDPQFIQKHGIIDVMGVKKHILAIPSADRPQDDEFKNFDRESLILLIEAQKERIGELMADRPQGEWIKPYGDSRFMCSICKCKENVPTCMDKPSVWDYCPNCGCRMKGADDE